MPPSLIFPCRTRPNMRLLWCYWSGPIIVRLPWNSSIPDSTNHIERAKRLISLAWAPIKLRKNCWQVQRWTGALSKLLRLVESMTTSMFLRRRQSRSDTLHSLKVRDLPISGGKSRERPHHCSAGMCDLEFRRIPTDLISFTRIRRPRASTSTRVDSRDKFEE